MANYEVKARSNHFKVKDETAFKEWASARALGVWELGDGEAKEFALYCLDEDGWPTSAYNEITEEEIDVCVALELPQHLKDGSVAVLMTCGSMGYVDLYGCAVAVNSKGEEVSINIDEIFDRAKPLGSEIDTM